MRSEDYETQAVDYEVVTIANGETTSTAFRLGSSHFLAFLLGSFTGTTVSFLGATEQSAKIVAAFEALRDSL